MLTGLIDSKGSHYTKNPVDNTPLYFGLGSSMHLSVSYTVNGETTHGTDGWFKIGGKPYKLSIVTSDEKVLKKSTETLLTPVAPGEVTVTVSLAGQTVKIPVLVVPLDIGAGESVDSVIRKIGMPDDDQYDSGAYHWKFNRYPGAVVVVDGKKVLNVSSTSPEYPSPKMRR
jgi:hypothetical protein